MIRHPLLLAVEVLASLLIAALGQLGAARPRPRPAPLTFSLTALGERELPDGSWQGADLLRTPVARTDRLQLTVRPDGAAQLSVDVVDPTGVHRLFPGAGQDGVLRAGRAYALPGPDSFYRLDGRARLQITLRPLGQGARAAPPAEPLPGAAVVRPYPLSDGARFDAEERAFGAGQLELEVRR